MQIYLSHASLPGRGAAEVLDQAIESGFDGIAVSDRDPQIWDPAAVGQLRARLEQTALGIVIDANADLTSSGPDSLHHQMQRLQCLMRTCAHLSAFAMRIAIGGQKIGVQRVLGRAQSIRNVVSPGVVRRLVSSRVASRLGQLYRSSRPGRPYARREALAVASRALRSLIPAATEANVRLAVENHWGVTTWPGDLVEIVEGADSRWVGICADFDNFPAGIDRYDALELLAPLALIAHARSDRFAADGEESSIDYRRCVGILARAGFEGLFCIEFLGTGDPTVGAIRTRDLIRRSFESLPQDS